MPQKAPHKLLNGMAHDDPSRDLAMAVDAGKVPAHIAIIMDGNGRWAKQRFLPRFAGHKTGVTRVHQVVEDCSNLGVKVLTLYAFSAENWKRHRVEVDTLWRLLRIYLRRDLATLQRNDIRLQSIGRVEMLPGPAFEDLRAVERATARNKGMTLNLALNYSGRIELSDAMNAIVDEARIEGRLNSLVIDEAAIARKLYTAGLPEPDLLIRTSGEMRVSNFLLWQIAYAELYVTNTLWPDFDRTELLKAILEFQSRDRRFGGLTPTVEPEEKASVIEAEEIAVSSK
jgi:undecaprenyl diphosphate synthase